MKKKIILLLLFVLVIIILIFGLIALNKGILFNNDKIQIIDATYNPSYPYQKIYEDNEYAYYLTGSNVDSVFVKFSNGNKMLVVRALNDDKVTIQELIDAGLDVHKERK